MCYIPEETMSADNRALFESYLASLTEQATQQEQQLSRTQYLHALAIGEYDDPPSAAKEMDAPAPDVPQMSGPAQKRVRKQGKFHAYKCLRFCFHFILILLLFFSLCVCLASPKPKKPVEPKPAPKPRMKRKSFLDAEIAPSYEPAAAAAAASAPGPVEPQAKRKKPQECPHIERLCTLLQVMSGVQPCK